MNLDVQLLFTNNIYHDNVEPLELAKYLAVTHCSFDEKEVNMMDMFWNPAFNGDWIYASDEIVRDYFGYKESKNMMTRFHKMLKQFDENLEYKEVTIDNELVQYYLDHSPSRGSDKGGELKKFYIITGETFKAVLLMSKTNNGKLIRKYYLKLEKLCMMTSQIISTCVKYMLQQKETIVKLQSDRISGLLCQNSLLEKDSSKYRTLYKNRLKRRDLANLQMGMCFYIVSDKRIEHYYKIGYTTNLTRRLGEHRTLFGYLQIHYIVYYENARLIEQMMLETYDEYLKPSNHEITKAPLEALIKSVKCIIEIFKKPCNETPFEQINEYNEIIDQLYVYDADENKDNETDDDEENNDEFRRCWGASHLTETDRILPLNKFSKHKGERGGFQRRCKKCVHVERHPDSEYVEQTIEIYDMDPSTEKRCKRCSKTKPHDQFYNDSSTTDGLGANCKACKAEQKKNGENIIANAKNNNLKKECIDCGVTKNLWSDFGLNINSDDNFKDRCKPCHSKLK